MQSSITGKAEFVIQEVGGCGLFQVLITFLVFFIGKASAVFSIYFLIFSIYNPGWTCLDDPENNTSVSYTLSAQSEKRVEHTNNTNLHGEDKNISRRNGSGFDKGYYYDGEEELFFDNNCTLFNACQKIQFDPTTSTFISEWGLLCDKAWVGSLIASLQMMGVLVGTFIVGQMGDAIGRKRTIYGAQIVVGVLNLVSIFSTSWQMMAVLRFFVGLACSANLSLAYVYVAEFATLKWRARISGIPTWLITAILCGLTMLAVKHWRHILIVTVVVSIIGFVPVVWVPESLRWLEVKQKPHEFMSVVKKITKVNRKELPSMDILMSMQSNNSTSNSSSEQKKRKSYLLLDLFRRGYRLTTLVIALEWFSCSVWYYTINFGVRNLYGNVYVNIVLVCLCEIPPNLIAMATPNLHGRKLTKLVWLGFAIVSFAVASCFRMLSSWENLQTTGVSVVILIAKAAVTGYWVFVYTHTVELYPTVVRCLALNWGGLFARIGASIAPFLVPPDPNSIFISYASMAALGVLCGLAISSLLETKGKPLNETFEDSGGGVDEHSDVVTI